MTDLAPGWLKRQCLSAAWSVASQPQWMRNLSSNYRPETEEEIMRQVVAHLREAKSSWLKLNKREGALLEHIDKALRITDRWDLDE